MVSVKKNAAWLMTATTLNKLIAFATFVVIAKLVGPTVTGTYFFGVSVTSLFVVLADLGMTPVVIRAISAAREDGERLLGAALRFKLFLIPIAIFASLGYVLLTAQRDIGAMWTVAIACLVLSADTIHLVLYGALRGRQNLKPEAFGMFIGQVLTAIGSVSAALVGFGAVGLVAALFIGSAWNVAWAAIQIKRWNISLRSPNRADVRTLAREAIPFGIAGISVKLYSYVDSLLLHAFHGATAVGMYAVAYKMTYALQFLPLTFTAALYPALAKYWAEKRRNELARTFLGSMRFLAAVGFPVSAGLSALAPQLISRVYDSRYDGAIAAFEILPWVLLPIFIDFPIGALLNATHRAHLKTTAMVITMLMNVGLNVWLVPLHGPVGAAWAGVVSFWMLMFIGLFFTRRDTQGIWPAVSILTRATGAAACAWVALRMIGGLFPLPIAIGFGAALSILLAFALKLITREDILRIHADA